MTETETEKENDTSFQSLNKAAVALSKRVTKLEKASKPAKSPRAKRAKK